MPDTSLWRMASQSWLNPGTMRVTVQKTLTTSGSFQFVLVGGVWVPRKSDGTVITDPAAIEAIATWQSNCPEWVANSAAACAALGAAGIV